MNLGRATKTTVHTHRVRMAILRLMVTTVAVYTVVPTATQSSYRPLRSGTHIEYTGTNQLMSECQVPCDWMCKAT